MRWGRRGLSARNPGCLQRALVQHSLLDRVDALLQQLAATVGVSQLLDDPAHIARVRAPERPERVTQYPREVGPTRRGEALDDFVGAVHAELEGEPRSFLRRHPAQALPCVGEKTQPRNGRMRPSQVVDQLWQRDRGAQRLALAALLRRLRGLGQPARQPRHVLEEAL
jgi:hypothetical protein